MKFQFFIKINDSDEIKITKVIFMKFQFFIKINDSDEIKITFVIFMKFQFFINQYILLLLKK
jgi:hypothetical protein